MTLHLVELPLSLRALNHWAGGRGLEADEGTALHHLLGETFGPATLQPFRLMVAPRAQSGTLFAYAAADADTLRAQAQFSLTPALTAVISLDRLRTLPRPAAAWTAGQRLGFDLRVRPVVRLGSDLTGTDDSGTPVSLRKGAEVDAFLANILRDRPSTREDAYLDWLAARLAPAAALDPAASRLTSFQRTRVMRNGRRVEGPDAVVHGTLNVTDPAAFSDLLTRGVGRHRSYGYGMLLLRPPQRVR